MIYYAVIDTNVVISAMLNPDSIPGLVLKYVLSGAIVPLLHDEIINEYEEVINRDKFGFDIKDINFIMSKLQEKGLFLDKTSTKEKFIDQKDIVFYEIVLTGRKDTGAYLVTGNLKHFPNKAFVVTPKEMIDIINSN